MDLSHPLSLPLLEFFLTVFDEKVYAFICKVFPILTCSEIIYLFQDQKKLQGQLIAEQEALYGSKPSPSKTQNVKKAPRMSTGGTSSRRVSVGGAMLQTPKPDPLQSVKATPRPSRKSDRGHQNDQLNPQDDGFSVLSAGRFFYFN